MKFFYNKYKEQILYLAFGVVVTLVNWVVYAVLVTVVNLGITLSNAIAWAVTIITAFVTNKLFVFESKSVGKLSVLKEALFFLLSRITTGIFEIIAPSLLVFIGLNGMLFGIDGFYAKLIVSVIVVILNYILSKKIVFKK